MNLGRLVVVVVLGIFLAGCAQQLPSPPSGSAKPPGPVTANGNGKGDVWRSLAVVPAGAVMLRPTLPREGDSFQILNVERVNDDLVVTVSYGGGCKEHEFKAFAPLTFKESNPVKTDVVVVHDANGDLCKTGVVRKLAFGLKPLKDAYQHAYGRRGKMTLGVYAAGSGEVQPSGSVVYE